jgi:hypothetical protein
MENVKFSKFLELKSAEIGSDFAHAALCGLLIAAIEDGYSVEKLNSIIDEKVKEMEN